MINIYIFSYSCTLVLAFGITINISHIISLSCTYLKFVFANTYNYSIRILDNSNNNLINNRKDSCLRAKPISNNTYAIYVND